MVEATPTANPAPRRRRMTAGLAVLAWCAAVAVAATAAWLVVDRAGISLLGGSGPGLSAGLGAATSTASSTASSTAGRSTTLSTKGGRVTGTCPSASRISLGGAIPADGWVVEVKQRGPALLRVEFKRGSQQVEVAGICRSGVAVLTLGDRPGSGGTSPAPASSSSTSDDHGGGSGGGSGGGGGSHGGSSSSDGGSHGGSGSGGSGGSGSGSGGSGKSSSGSDG